MRSLKYLLTAALMLGLSAGAYAELQNVEIGGQLTIRGNYLDGDGASMVPNVSWVEQRTRLNIKADFTDEVTTFFEFDHYNAWGEDFRSDYVTGLDFRGNGDVALYQAYIEASEMWGVPLRARIGRQEIALGSQWLVGVNDANAFPTGLSFDAIRLTYGSEADMFTLDAIWAKLNERAGDIFDDDTDMYAIYGSYLGLEDIALDAYWIWVRDDNPGQLPFAGINNVLDVDIHTIGLRGAGTVGAFDFEAEAAYQWGEIDRPRVNLFRTQNFDYGEWALNLELGYTFDMQMNPRVHAGFAYFGGSDPANSNRRWGLFGLRGGDTDLSFNRLFSNKEYSKFLDNWDRDLTNVLIYNLGLSIMPTESLELALVGSYFQVDDELITRRWFRQQRAGDSLGYEVGINADYHYTEDLVFRAGYAHFFARSGMFDNNAVVNNGLTRVFADTTGDNYNYLFFETEISF